MSCRKMIGCSMISKLVATDGDWQSYLQSGLADVRASTSRS